MTVKWLIDCSLPSILTIDNIHNKILRTPRIPEQRSGSKLKVGVKVRGQDERSRSNFWLAAVDISDGEIYLCATSPYKEL